MITREIHVPHNPVSAAGVVLEDLDAVRALLQQLADHLRLEPTTAREFVRQRQLLGLSVEIAQLVDARQTAQARRDAGEKSPELVVAAASVTATPQVPTEAPAAPRSPASARGKGQKKKRRRRR